MSTSWKSQQSNGKYSLQFETDDKEKYKLVERAAQMAVDGEIKPEVETFKIGDVVPREEVVELENKLTQYEQVCGKLIVKDGVGIGLLPDGKETVYILKSIASVTKELAIRRTKQEVAREIFEEIEELFFKNGVFIHIHSYNELKKRYVPEVT